jgi:heme exporter protein D
MQWNSVAEFWAMGGHGFYVWGSFGVTALVMLGESLLIRRQRTQLLRELAEELGAPPCEVGRS